MGFLVRPEFQAMIRVSKDVGRCFDNQRSGLRRSWSGRNESTPHNCGSTALPVNKIDNAVCRVEEGGEQQDLHLISA